MSYFIYQTPFHVPQGAQSVSIHPEYGASVIQQTTTKQPWYTGITVPTQVVYIYPAQLVAPPGVEPSRQYPSQVVPEQLLYQHLPQRQKQISLPAQNFVPLVDEQRANDSVPLVPSYRESVLMPTEEVRERGLCRLPSAQEFGEIEAISREKCLVSQDTTTVPLPKPSMGLIPPSAHKSRQWSNTDTTNGAGLDGPLFLNKEGFSEHPTPPASVRCERQSLSTPTSPRTIKPNAKKYRVEKKEIFSPRRALFFGSKIIDSKFISKYIAINTDRFHVDTSRPINEVKVSENDLIEWLVLDFLVVDLKMHDRRRDTSPLIHDYPENRFDVCIQFELNKTGKSSVQKTVKVNLTLLKALTASLDPEEVASQLIRLFSEDFLFRHTASGPVRAKRNLKKKRTKAKPQWSLGSDNELIIIGFAIEITNAE